MQKKAKFILNSAPDRMRIPVNNRIGDVIGLPFLAYCWKYIFRIKSTTADI